MNHVKVSLITEHDSGALSPLIRILGACVALKPMYRRGAVTRVPKLLEEAEATGRPRDSFMVLGI